MPRSLRLLWRSKRFVTLAVLALGIAIALDTTMYSVMETLVNPPSAIGDPEHLYSYAYYGEGIERVPQQERNRDVASLPFVTGAAGSRSDFLNSHFAERGRNSRDVRIENVTPTFFSVLQVEPLYGRLLGPSDVDAAGSPVVISDRLWEALFPGEEWCGNESVDLDGEPHTVVGVVANLGNAGVWLPFPGNALADAAITELRVRPDVSAREVAGTFAALGRNWAARYGLEANKVALRVESSAPQPFRYRRFHVALIGAVIALMLVACVNLANLQLARGVARARELATRTAVGASRRNLIAQLVAESSWIALGGLVVGVLLTFWAMYIVRATLPPSLEDYIMRPRVSWGLFAFAALAALVCLVGIGLFPAIRLSRVDPAEVLKSGAGTGVTRRSGRQYGALVVVQVALALPLVAASALLMRTAWRAISVDVAGYHNLVVGFALFNQGLRPDAARVTASDMIAQMRNVPGVADAAYEAQSAPLRRIIAIDDPGGAPSELKVGLWHFSVASSSALRTMGLRIHSGRDFSEGEFAQPVAILDQRSAAFLFHGADPVGRLIKFGPLASEAPWIRIIGVAEGERAWRGYFGSLIQDEMKHATPALENVWVLDTPKSSPTPHPWETSWYRVYVRGKPEVNIGRLPVLLRQHLSTSQSAIRFVRLSTWDDATGLTAYRQRITFVASLFSVFAFLGLAVALMGVFAVVSQAVAQREREFAVRKALGASDGNIREHVFGYGRVPCLLGVALGLVFAAKSVNLLFAFLASEDDVYSAGTFGLVALGFLGAALVACWFPARRAVKLEPVVALRHE
jgi:predicted permease